MNAHADKTQENKSQSLASSASRMKSGDESTFQFVDNRAEAIAQIKLQEMADNSPQAKQATQLRAMVDNHSTQQQPIQKKENKTGLPDNLKSGIENLSGYSMDDVKVHYNAYKPVQLQAHAYAQGTDIHLGSGRENHLPHEAWHVVQQAQGRVPPTTHLRTGVLLNDEQQLETEADIMGAKALMAGTRATSIQLKPLSHNAHRGLSNCPIQGVLIGADQFHSAEEILQSGDEEDYLVHYTEITKEVRQYNLASDEIEIISRLNRLDILRVKVTQCLELITAGEFAEQSTANQRKGHLALLKDSIATEKSEIISEKTEDKDVLPGREGILRAGMAWELKRGEDEWVNASGVLREQNTLAINIIDSVDENYIFKFQLGETNTGRIAMQQLELKSKFTADDSALFPINGEPVKEDVLQTNLGDCYLQAALAGLAAGDPAFIKKMLYDEGENVVVRLFRLPEKTAQYIRVQRSKAQTQEGADLYNAGAIWVKMIQKAYAAGNFAMDLLGHRKRGALVDIAGDMVGYTMGVLTGRNLDSFDAAGEEKQSDAKEATKFPWGFDVGTLWMCLQDDDIPSHEDESEVFKEYQAALALLNPLFQDNAERIKSWAEFADEHSDALDDFKTINEFAAFFTKKALDLNITQVIIEWVRASGFYRGTVGSGVYSTGQLAVLDEMETALGQRKLLTVGSQKKLSQEDDQELGGSGEPKYKGLAGGHAYTILNIRKSRTRNPESADEGNIHWIQLRNPWGQYGRSYNEDWAPVAIEEGNGVFWIELTDFAKNFTDIEII